MFVRHRHGGVDRLRRITRRIMRDEFHRPLLPLGKACRELPFALSLGCRFLFLVLSPCARPKPIKFFLDLLTDRQRLG